MLGSKTNFLPEVVVLRGWTLGSPLPTGRRLDAVHEVPPVGGWLDGAWVY